MFGYPCGPERDVPENTTPKFKMALTRPPFAVVGNGGEKIRTQESLATICHFEWTGKLDIQTGARVYYLTDIEKV